MRSHKLGQDGEAFAQEFLTAQGYQILKLNYRTKTGEIDIVAKDAETIVFVEVKTREAGGWDAFEAVTPAKQRRLIRTATWFLIETFGREDVAARFDVLAVEAAENGTFRGDLLKNAFFVR